MNNTELAQNINNSKIVFEDGEIKVKVSIDDDTVWLNRHQLAELFDKDIKTIGKHINNIFNDEELIKDMVVAKFATTTQHGAIEGKTQTKLVEYYNLDLIISVGYRVKSKRGIKFRQWATKVLREYVFNGYAINREKITQQRLLHLEQDVNYIKSHIQTNTLEVKQGIFYDGQIYDAYIFVNNLLKNANKEIILVDNYIDDSVLTIFSKYPNLHFKIITKSLSKQLKLDIEKYNSQYANLTIKLESKYHDRFLVIDNSEAYHIGASLKDLGKKVFAFNKIDIILLDELV